MYRKILVPLDGSTFAEHALPLALALARRAHAGIHLVTVSTPVWAASLEGAYVNPPEVEEELIAAYQTYLETTIARMHERIDAPITGEVVFGGVAETLCQLADCGKYDLMVMATHGRNPLGRFFLGSVGDEMIHRVNLPLLVVRPETKEVDLGKEPDLNRVVLPLDGTPLAEQIIEPAVALAGLMPETEIVLVRAVHNEAVMDAPDEGPVRVEANKILLHLKQLQVEARREAEDYLAAVARCLEARGLRVKTHVVVEDRPAEAILHEAEGEHAGLIALETHGRHGLSRLLHGSVADQVVRNAHVPILIQRPVKV